MNYFAYHMPPGRLTIVADGDELVRILFGAVELPCELRSSTVTNTAATELLEYFAGKRTSFDIPYRLKGSAFQRRVWEASTHIPYGQTLTYQDVAEGIGKPTSFRAVGSAVAHNPLPIVVPTHRIVASDGTVGDFADAPKVKQYLVELERRHRLHATR
jgi:methylated-DNA-[protein]-cysteine S-methyltransferase